VVVYHQGDPDPAVQQMARDADYRLREVVSGSVTRENTYAAMMEWQRERSEGTIR
jgi:hypothetical protein